MNINDHHTIRYLQTMYRTEKDARLARRIHGVYLAARGLSCTQIMTITGAARRTIQQWVRKYNKHRIDGLKDKPQVPDNRLNCLAGKSLDFANESRPALLKKMVFRY